ncbi:MAG: DUF3473 domain-containing protein, partial [Pyrinomonadaceae bacterium]|nr:DUF3473 domain-containing protein [Pyrinomonadaceae bacterium]
MTHRFCPSKKTKIHTADKIIWEFPYSTRNIGLGLLPIAGGNYFRQIPYTLMRNLVKDWTNRYDKPFVMYFHVWELDAEQPRINAASKFNQIRHYRKLDKMEWIIKENLQKYEFTNVSEFLGIESQVSSLKSQVSNRIETIQNPKSKIQNPSVSVVIPCYNEESALPYLANTLRSVEAELNETGYNPNFIFVDDCSKDNTFNLLHELFGKKENVQIVKHEQNQGVAAGIMTGLKAAKTEIVCSMDCD